MLLSRRVLRRLTLFDVEKSRTRAKSQRHGKRKREGERERERESFGLSGKEKGKEKEGTLHFSCRGDRLISNFDSTAFRGVIICEFYVTRTKQKRDN